MVSVSNYIGEVTSRNMTVLPQWVSRYDIDYLCPYYILWRWNLDIYSAADGLEHSSIIF